MTQLTPQNIQQFFEQAAKASVDAFKTQTSYLDALVKRNTRLVSTLAGARLSSFKEMTASKTFNQAFEANLAFEEKVREELGRLQEDNLKAWEAFQASLKAIYTPASEAARASAPKKAAPARATVKKSTPRKAAPKNTKAAKAAPGKAKPKPKKAA